MPQKGVQAWQPFLPADFAGGVQKVPLPKQLHCSRVPDYAQCSWRMGKQACSTALFNSMSNFVLIMKKSLEAITQFLKAEC